MWQRAADWIMTYLDPLGVVLGIAIAVPVVWTWWDVVFGSRRRTRRWFREARRHAGDRPAVLIVDLLTERNVRAAINRYLARDPVLKGIPDERIVTVRRDRRLTPNDMPDLVRELRRKAAQLINAGADTVHYFHAGPAAVAALVGAEFANTCRVMLYQHESDGYSNFGPLRLNL